MKTIVDLENDLVKPYIDAKDLAEAQTRAILGAHNLVPFPYFASSYTTNGITFTVNSDGTITANGTATALAIFDAINGELYAPFSLDAGDYILTDGLAAADYSNAYTAITLMHSDGTTEYNYADTSTNNNDFTMPAPSTIKYFYLGCCIKSGATVSNLVFKPMIRLASDSDETYRSYAPKNNNLLSYAANGILGAKNLLPNNAQSQVINGITFTVNNDGSVTVSGTASGNAGLEICTIMNGGEIVDKSLYDAISGKTLILSGCPSGGSDSTYELDFNRINNNDDSAADRGNGTTFTFEKTTTTGKVYVTVYIHSGAVITTPITFKPMLRLADDTDTIFHPYTMTNRQLTKEFVRTSHNIPRIVPKDITSYITDGSFWKRLASTDVFVCRFQTGIHFDRLHLR